MRILANRAAMVREIFRPGDVIAELGTHEGHFAEVLVRQTKPATLHLVDNFTVKIQGADGAAAQARVRERFAAELAAGQVQLHVTDTVEWLAAQPASSLDGGYADSTHTDEHLFRELCQLLRVVKVGGWIAGHDYSSCSTPGVVTAVNRFCRLHGQRIELVTDEPEFELQNRAPWQPHRGAFNSYAIRVEK